jgi:N-acylneuraminate cytidylyltransferase
MNIVALIPARSGSKAIPKKNIQVVGNHPLIAYSIAAGKISEYIDDVIVTTDSEEIAKISKKYGACVPFLRPASISGDHSTDIEFFNHYLEYLKKNRLIIPDLIIHLRPTTPFREISDVDAAIKYMVDNPEATALRSMVKTNITPFKLFKKNGEFAEPFLDYKGIKEFYNLPRQTFEDTFDPNGVVDIIRLKVLKKTGMLHGTRIKLWEVDKVADIDNHADLEYAKELINDKRFLELFNYLKGFNG